MKVFRNSALAVAVGAGALGLGCEEERKAARPAVEDVQAKVRDAAQAALDYVAGAKDDYVAEAEREIEAVGARIRALESEAAKASAEVRKGVVAQLRTLETKKSELLRKLGDMKAHRAKVDAQLTQLDESLGELSARLGELRQEASKASGEARARTQAEIDELTRRRDELTKDLERLEASSHEAWDDMRAGLDSALGDLRDAYAKASRKLD